MGTKTYFKKEAKDILEMAYQVLNVVFLCYGTHFVLFN